MFTESSYCHKYLEWPYKFWEYTCTHLFIFQIYLGFGKKARLKVMYEIKFQPIKVSKTKIASKEMKRKAERLPESVSESRRWKLFRISTWSAGISLLKYTFNTLYQSSKFFSKANWKLDLKLEKAQISNWKFDLIW